MEKIKRLREILDKEKIDGYLIPKMMNFLGNTLEYNDRLNFISNFTGSFGFH